MDHPHVLLISLDTVRRDHLGCYGLSREVTPHLDRLAEGGVRCAGSVANCGWTLPQHMTLFTLVESADVAPTVLAVAGVEPLPEAQGRSLLPRMLGQSSDAPEFVCSHTAHEHQGEGGSTQFDHYAIQTTEHKLIRTELHADPDDLAGDWKQRFQKLCLRVWRDPATLRAGDVFRELYDLIDDPVEQRTLIPEGEVHGPRRPARVTHEDAKAIASDLEAKLDDWIEQTRNARKA